MPNSSSHSPPRLAQRFLHRLCASRWVEEIEGDLQEQYDAHIAEGSLWRAKLLYWKEMLLFIRPYILRRETPDYDQASGLIMYKNYLKVALRNVRKYAAYSFINITGLAVGMACCLLIFLYVQDELSYDRFHPHADRLYRIVEDVKNNDSRVQPDARTAPALLPWLENDLSAVEKASRLFSYEVLSGALLSRDGTLKFQEPRFFFADSTFLDMFGYELVQGNRETALDQPMSVLITEEMAVKYFGSEAALGQTVRFENDESPYEFTVTGVLANMPTNTHVGFDFLASFNSLRLIDSWVETTYHWSPSYLYTRLAPGADPALAEAELAGLVRERWGEQRAESHTYHFQPVTSIHLTSHRENEAAPNSDIAYVYIFSLIAICILLIACINFMNLATARSANRAREVGMRKVLGALRPQLIRQFLAESILMAFLGLVLALVLIPLLLPIFNAISGKALLFSSLLTPATILLLVGIMLVVGILAGSYPAFYLSAFGPIQVLKGLFSTNSNASGVFRKGLVVFQFAMSSVLIVGTGIVYQQLDYLQNKNLGFSPEQVIVAHVRDANDQQNYEALKNEWLQSANVLSVSGSASVPSFGGIYDFQVVPEQAAVDSLQVLTLAVDHDFARVFGLDILEGRDFSEDFGTDLQQGFLVNEAFAETMGWNNPIGERLRLDFHLRGSMIKNGAIIGVVKDFHFRSLHNAVDPLIIHLVPPSYYTDFISARIASTDVTGTLAFLEQKWQAFNPNRPFEFTFLDTEFEALYRAEERLSQLFGYFAVLAVLIACLGLFGLASYTAEQRTKEIGVRKVMGASVGGIIVLLSKDFLRLVAIAFVAAVPITYIIMNNWLDTFAYHIDIGVGTFVLAGVLAILIALVTVSYQAIRAALINPVRALRYE